MHAGQWLLLVIVDSRLMMTTCTQHVKIWGSTSPDSIIAITIHPWLPCNALVCNTLSSETLAFSRIVATRRSTKASSSIWTAQELIAAEGPNLPTNDSYSSRHCLHDLVYIR